MGHAWCTRRGAGQAIEEAALLMYGKKKDSNPYVCVFAVGECIFVFCCACANARMVLDSVCLSEHVCSAHGCCTSLCISMCTCKCTRGLLEHVCVRVCISQTEQASHI